MGAPFEQSASGRGTLRPDIEERNTWVSPVTGCVYIFWNQRRYLPSTAAFVPTNVQILRPPPEVSLKSAFGSAIVGLGDIDHDGIDGMTALSPILSDSIAHTLYSFGLIVCFIAITFTEERTFINIKYPDGKRGKLCH